MTSAAYLKKQESEGDSYIAQGLVLEYQEQAEELLQKIRAIVGQENPAISNDPVMQIQEPQTEGYSVEDILSIINNAGTSAEIEDVLGSVFTSIEASILRDKAKAKKHEEFLKDYLAIIEINSKQMSDKAPELQVARQNIRELSAIPQQPANMELLKADLSLQKLPHNLQQQLMQSLKSDFQQTQAVFKQIQDSVQASVSRPLEVQLATRNVSSELVRQAEQVREMAQSVAKAKPEQVQEKAGQVEKLLRENITATQQVKQQPEIRVQQTQLLDNLVTSRINMIQQVRQAVMEHAAQVPQVRQPVSQQQFTASQVKEAVKDSTAIPKAELQKIVEKIPADRLVKPATIPPKPVQELQPQITVQKIDNPVRKLEIPGIALPPSRPEKPHICGGGCPEHGSKSPPSQAHNHDCAKVHGAADIAKMAESASRVESIKASGARWQSPPQKTPQTDSASLMKLADLILAA